MEDPLRTIRNLAGLLDRVAQTLADDNGAMIVQELAMMMLARVKELDDIHGYFFELHHPDRERFDEADPPSTIKKAAGR